MRIQSVRGHQRPSEAIRGHQRPSEAIRGHQRPSEAIRGHAVAHLPFHSLASYAPSTNMARDALCVPGSMVHGGWGSSSWTRLCRSSPLPVRVGGRIMLTGARANESTVEGDASAAFRQLDSALCKRTSERDHGAEKGELSHSRRPSYSLRGDQSKAARRTSNRSHEDCRGLRAAAALSHEPV